MKTLSLQKISCTRQFESKSFIALICIIFAEDKHINQGEPNMTDISNRKLPTGIQSFKEIREEGYLYVDKSDLIWHLANHGKKYNYLSRPRRFGKSILINTLQMYFEGRKELFEGLKIMQLEKEWKQYLVIRLDMSLAGAEPKRVWSYLDNVFHNLESEYNIAVRQDSSLAVRFQNIIEGAYNKTGNKVVILIDEYDSPLQHSWKTEHHKACTEVYRDVFAVLKACDEYEKFVFITGITKFTQISLFSVLNNLTNISFLPEYATICGITEEEILTNFKPELEKMGEVNNWTLQETHDKLKAYYDGYHFSNLNMVDDYNPFSLVNALYQKRLRSYWASSGATSLLPKFVNDIELHLDDFDNCSVLSTTLESSDVTGGGPELFLYQSGYLTIKDCDEFGYILGIPNEEVRQALNEMVLPALTMRKQGDIQSLQSNLYRQLGTCMLDDAKKTMRSLIADVPYSNKKLASMDMEERYRLIISTILNAIGIRVEVERMLATGRIDLVAWLSRYIYVIELKLSNSGGIAAAEQQIRNCGYTEPFKGDKRKVVGLAVELDSEGKGLVEWKVVDSVEEETTIVSEPLFGPTSIEEAISRVQDAEKEYTLNGRGTTLQEFTAELKDEQLW